VRAAALGALAAAVTGAAVQGGAPYGSVAEDRRTATERPAQVQDCRKHGPTTYCAFPEFVPWTGEWDAVVREVRALVPDDAAGRELLVRQRVHATDGPQGPSGLGPGQAPPPADTPSDEESVQVPTLWGGADEARLLAAGTAYALVTGASPEQGQGAMCDARGVLVMYLAARATDTGPDTGAERRTASVMGPGASGPTLVVRGQEHQVVRALLERPGDEVDRRVEASWDELVRPGTGTERAAELLGVRAPALTDDDRAYQCG
jgi:hypothetical protein